MSERLAHTLVAAALGLTSIGSMHAAYMTDNNDLATLLIGTSIFTGILFLAVIDSAKQIKK